MYPYSRSPFSRFAKWTARATGHPLAFVLAAATIVVWLVTGPIFGFSDTWQLVINYGHHRRHLSHGLSHPEHPEPR